MKPNLRPTLKPTLKIQYGDVYVQIPITSEKEDIQLAIDFLEFFKDKILSGVEK